MRSLATKGFSGAASARSSSDWRSPQRAIEAAKKRFAWLERIRDRKFHAALIEIEAKRHNQTRSTP